MIDLTIYRDRIICAILGHVQWSHVGPMHRFAPFGLKRCARCGSRYK